MNQPSCEENPNMQLLKKRMDTLKHNLENVPLDILKTRYKKAYDKFCVELKELTAAYIKDISLKDLRFKRELYPEAKAIIEKTIADSGIVKECSRAVFQRQDFDELKQHTERLREAILYALQPFYEAHTCLYILPECLKEPYPTPYIYNYATGYFFIDNQWVDKPDMADGLLMFVQKKKQIPEGKLLQEDPLKTA